MRWILFTAVLGAGSILGLKLIAMVAQRTLTHTIDPNKLP